MANPRMLKFGNAPHSCFDHCLMNQEEVVKLIDLCKRRTVIEIGSFRGGSAELIAPVCKHLTCIDPHADIEWNDVPDGKSITITKGEDVKAEFLRAIAPFSNVTYLQLKSDDAIPFIDRVDVVFIDGDHSYDQCLKDLQNYQPFAKRYVLVHDYCMMFAGIIAACQNHFGRLPNAVVGTLAVYKLTRS